MSGRDKPRRQKKCLDRWPRLEAWGVCYENDDSRSPVLRLQSLAWFFRPSFGGRAFALGQLWIVIASHRKIQPGPDGSADDRRHPEEPQLLQRPAAATTNRENQCRTSAARGVDRGVGDRHADQVNERQRQPDSDRRKAGGQP